MFHGKLQRAVLIGESRRVIRPGQEILDVMILHSDRLVKHEHRWCSILSSC